MLEIMMTSSELPGTIYVPPVGNQDAVAAAIAQILAGQAYAMSGSHADRPLLFADSVEEAIETIIHGQAGMAVVAD